MRETNLLLDAIYEHSSNKRELEYCELFSFKENSIERLQCLGGGLQFLEH